MSRHEVPGIKPGTKVFVGWDRPLQTYFVQIYDPRREGPRVWLGGDPRELYDLQDLKRVIQPHAYLSPELLAKLYAERDEGL